MLVQFSLDTTTAFVAKCCAYVKPSLLRSTMAVKRGAWFPFALPLQRECCIRYSCIRRILHDSILAAFYMSLLQQHGIVLQMQHFLRTETCILCWASMDRKQKVELLAA